MRSRVALPALVGLALLMGLAAVALGRAARAAGEPAHPRHLSHVAMTDAAMQRMAASWWAAHPPVGAASAQVAAVTFKVGNFFFDDDNNTGTQVDTAKITVGESVQWQWVTGFHTITNGTGGSDPGAGSLFDQPSDSGHLTFTFTFNTAGTFPFFCRFHELNNMRGVVVVKPPAGVGPQAVAQLGFTADPAPNPTTRGARFRFALRQTGRVRADVFDVRGRLVATVVDRDLPAGSHEAVWDGHNLTGGVASAGIYYVRLRLPGFAGSRPLVIAR